MQNGIVLSNLLGMGRTHGYFPLSLRWPGNRRTGKLEYVAGRRVGSTSDDGVAEAGIRISNQLTTALCNAIALRIFDIAKQSLQGDPVVRLWLRCEANQCADLST
jgi:hypothetical protein